MLLPQANIPDVPMSSDEKEESKTITSVIYNGLLLVSLFLVVYIIYLIISLGKLNTASSECNTLNICSQEVLLDAELWSTLHKVSTKYNEELKTHNEAQHTLDKTLLDKTMPKVNKVSKKLHELLTKNTTLDVCFTGSNQLNNASSDESPASLNTILKKWNELYNTYDDLVASAQTVKLITTGWNIQESINKISELMWQELKKLHELLEKNQTLDVCFTGSNQLNEESSKQLSESLNSILKELNGLCGEVLRIMRSMGFHLQEARKEWYKALEMIYKTCKQNNYNNQNNDKCSLLNIFLHKVAKSYERAAALKPSITNIKIEESTQLTAYKTLHILLKNLNSSFLLPTQEWQTLNSVKKLLDILFEEASTKTYEAAFSTHNTTQTDETSKTLSDECLKIENELLQNTIDISALTTPDIFTIISTNLKEIILPILETNIQSIKTRILQMIIILIALFVILIIIWYLQPI